MKKLLTTTLVLAMIVSMFCISPVVNAAEAPAMEISIDYANTDDIIIKATFKNVSDALWVNWSVKSVSPEEYIYMDEKRGNKAQEFEFKFTSEESALKARERFTAEAKITNSDGTVTSLPPKHFICKTYVEVQEIIREMLTGADDSKSIGGDESYATDLTMTLSSYYRNFLDDDIIDALKLEYPQYENAYYDPEYGTYYPENEIPFLDFYDDLKEQVKHQAINSGNTTLISTILDDSYAEFGITADLQEKRWYDGPNEDENENVNKSAIVSRLAGFDEYADDADFVEKFRTVVVLNKISKTNSTDIIEDLRDYNGNYKKFDVEESLDLDFAEYDILADNSTKEEFAGTYMVGTYNTIEDLESRFAELLIALPDVEEPGNPAPAPSPSVSVPPSAPVVSVSPSTPIVGDIFPFTDCDDVDWAHDAIKTLAAEGVIEGVGSRQFQPNANVTREQFVKIIVNTFGLKGTGKTAVFEDVDQNEWYAPYINTAVELGIINGVSDTMFGVGQLLTRQDMTVIMYRVANYIGKNIAAKSDRAFSDANTIDDYAIEAVTALYKAEIVNGVADGVFGGWQTATRAQAAKLCFDLRKAN